MQGVILDEMRTFVAGRYGYRAWMETLKRAGREPTHRYQLDEVYPDEELGLLTRHAAEVTATPPLELLEAFGETLAPDMMRFYAYLVDPQWSYSDFLFHMEPLLHQALQLHTPGAIQPKIHATRISAGLVTLLYDSPLRACAALAGVIRGAAKEYGARVRVNQEECVLRGAPYCLFRVEIDPASPNISAAG